MSRYDNQGQYYGAPQQSYGNQADMRDRQYGSYVPPTDESYGRHDMAVERYDERNRRDNGRRSSRGRYGDDYDSRYDDNRRRSYDDRRSRSRGSRKDRSRSKSRASSKFREYGDRAKDKVSSPEAKELGATVLGAAVGAFAGRELGHKSGMATAIGAIAGGWGAHTLEQRYEEKKEHRRDSKYEDDRSGHNHRRSGSQYDDEESGYEPRRNSRSRYDRYD